MSKIPTYIKIAPITQQVDQTLKSVVATCLLGAT